MSHNGNPIEGEDFLKSLILFLYEQNYENKKNKISPNWNNETELILFESIIKKK